ncbi:hypothetical protein DASC09_036930 [Saccharomycopsis crataegensis]|uniref:USP8 dimerisation domain-containing protein n=1 Tax=Saccharomycopsis crataegensis TaxID=43959 RepID=A0AAV5QNL6_9ASCO|nr:hypothetical protein DASC09_036930 [Saccharomycopsis crataegensis]
MDFQSQSISELMKRSLQYDYSNLTPYSTWLDIADSFLEQAIQGLETSNYEKAYIDLARFIDLILNKLPLHPDFYPNERYEDFKHSEIPEALKTTRDILNKLMKTKENSRTFKVTSMGIPINDRADLMSFINNENSTACQHQDEDQNISQFYCSYPYETMSPNSLTVNSFGINIAKIDHEYNSVSNISKFQTPNSYSSCQAMNYIHSSRDFPNRASEEDNFASPLTPERTTFALVNNNDYSLHDYNASIEHNNNNNPDSSSRDHKTRERSTSSRRRSSRQSSMRYSYHFDDDMSNNYSDENELMGFNSGKVAQNNHNQNIEEAIEEMEGSISALETSSINNDSEHKRWFFFSFC